MKIKICTAVQCACVLGLGLLQEERKIYFYTFSVALVYSVYIIYNGVQ